jgi:glycosyltransferase involved in cell wall biosynthesis
VIQQPPPLRVGIVCDYREERWPSMDLVADMLLDTLGTAHASQVDPVELRPSMTIRFGEASLLAGAGHARNADRLISRFIDYPRWLSKRQKEASVFHIVDHSYAHLVHALPAQRTVVTCHDLDTFRSVLDPHAEPRGWVFRAMTRRILSGLQRAAMVICDSNATRDGILAHGLVPSERLDVVYLGVDPIMSPQGDPVADDYIRSLLAPPDAAGADLLHVGSTIPRKRIDILLRTFAAVRGRIPATRLIRVGGAFTASQTALARDLRIDPSAIIVLPYLDRAQLAAVYRRAALVLQPSDAEGFGLPVVEAMACGTPVVASDLAVLREVGGVAATYCPVGDVGAWSGTVCAMLGERSDAVTAWAARRRAALDQSARFSWSRFAERMVDVYRAVAEASPR